MIGVDVENLQRTNSHQNIAKRFFSNSEAAFLERIDEAQKPMEFLRLWTLKEAFVKARGLGLSIPLNSFEISTFSDQPARVSFQNGIHGNEANWRFLQIRVGRSFHIAIALTMPKPKEMAVKFSTITPLTNERASVMLEPNRLHEWEIDGI
jgi:4'-phosphopantetheinyl transferase